MKSVAVAILLSFVPAVLLAQNSLDGAMSSVQSSLDNSLQELKELREEVAEKKVPLAKELNSLNAEVRELRKEFEKTSRTGDAKTLDISSLEVNVKQRQDEVDYVISLMTEYISNIESRADPSERALYQDMIDETLKTVDDPELKRIEVITAQVDAITKGIGRVDSLIGGQLFEGEAVVPSGDLESGSFVLFGPVSYFASGSGSSGLALEGSSGQPSVIDIEGESGSIGSLASSSAGTLPLDPTLGKAIAIASTDETISEHVLKGGVWVFPILGFAFVSLVISIYKLYELMTIKKMPSGSITKVVKLIRSGKKEEALREAKSVPGPMGDMLHVGTQSSEEPKELLEEILLEKMVSTQPKIERLLSIIAVTAATAPLLGLLGTVTGMINTFKLITIFGTGDAKSLSGGISEALITTEFGLIVAIPSLIFHAFLSRKAKSIMASMERSAMSFVNGVKAKSD
ncbi:MotA/TolQ/ExbB proton channel family protein [Puniceicoccaceae bacterium K14]|nr:MotA/TolQ/ExbB proton channel family protein [Puniceicoccaceae bacterium K14]